MTFYFYCHHPRSVRVFCRGRFLVGGAFSRSGADISRWVVCHGDFRLADRHITHIRSCCLTAVVCARNLWATHPHEVGDGLGACDSVLQPAGETFVSCASTGAGGPTRRSGSPALSKLARRCHVRGGLAGLSTTRRLRESRSGHGQNIGNGGNCSGGAEAGPVRLLAFGSGMRLRADAQCTFYKSGDLDQQLQLI